MLFLVSLSFYLALCKEKVILNDFVRGPILFVLLELCYPKQYVIFLYDAIMYWTIGACTLESLHKLVVLIAQLN